MLIPDLLRDDLRVVFCGTALGTASAERKLYYAGPGNRFWTILKETRLTPDLLTPDRYRELLDHGIGLTDIVKDQSGPDTALAFHATGRRALEAKMHQFQPAVLCFNGKRAAQEFLGTKNVSYGRQSRRIGATIVFTAPSTSGAAIRWWNTAIWHDLAALVRAPGPR